MIYLQDPDVTLHHGDVLETLRGMPDGSVDCVITSPPYWGLRDYSTPGQLGLEATPDLFVARMVEVFREVRRVLAAHGTAWCNMGDSYTTGGLADWSKWDRPNAHVEENARPRRTAYQKATAAAGLKQKDLVGMPWRVAFALQADGWCLRSDVVWSKPNPMPESVTDRPTKAHEYVFLLTKCEWRGIENPLRLDRADAMWLAAMIDGEGSVCVNTRKGAEGEQPTYSAALRCYNASREIIERVAALTGVGTIGQTSGSGENGTRVVYRWQCGGKTAVPILDAIEPYLIAKRQQAHLLLELQGMRRHHGGRTGAGGAGANPRPALLTRRQEEIARGCSELNRTGETDVLVVPWKRGYWKPLPYTFDQEAVREGVTGNAHSRGNGVNPKALINAPGEGVKQNASYSGAINELVSSRNIRSVWEIPTQPYPEAHFATYPEELVRRCLLAGCPEWVCRVCGKPRERIVEASYTVTPGRGPTGTSNRPRAGDRDTRASFRPRQNLDRANTTTGWSDCGHANYRPGIVLDPFVGSGTTAHVARKHGRHAIGIDLNADYLKLAAKRLQQQSLFSEGVA